MRPRTTFTNPKKLPFEFRSRKAVFHNVADIIREKGSEFPDEEIKFFEELDLIYRTMCGILYNFVPLSGHPGGSLSSGRIVEGLLYGGMDYDFSKPDIPENDIIAYTAGHKAMGLYGMWALRNEIVRIADPSLLAPEKRQLRLEDLLGFRKNVTQGTPLFEKFKSVSLDGHPSCIVPFVKTATGPSGVGVGAAFGLAFGALDVYPDDPPAVHLIEGEGGMTPGRVYEAIAAAASAQLHNAIMHIDWNQSTIDSDRCTAEGEQSGDYVQWDPCELLYLNGFNVIFAPEGHNFHHVFTAQKLALSLNSQVPTAIVYRTVKGWTYGITGKASHGAGYKFCSPEFYKFIEPFERHFNVPFPRFAGDAKNPVDIEKYYWDTLLVIRSVLEENTNLVAKATEKIRSAKGRLEKRNIQKRTDSPQLEKIYDGEFKSSVVPDELKLKTGESTTIRGQLGKLLNLLNKKTNGALVATAADLLESTSIATVNKGFPEGLFNAVRNPGSRLVAVGGICEDAMGAFMSGVSSYRQHMGISASYAAFIVAMEHTAARCHCIGQQNYWERTGEPMHTWIMVNGHAGPKTGEDGPTHADPQCLQLLTEGFPKGKLITLTPWSPDEVWPLMIEGLMKRPAVLAPFVTRPSETIVDRKKLGLPDATTAAKGIYAFRKADMTARQYNGTLVIQGCGAASVFLNGVIDRLDQKGLNMNIYYVASAELFKLLTDKEQEHIFPESFRTHAMGLTDFTLPTLYQWIRWNEGLRRTLSPFRNGHYLSTGTADKVLEEAGLHSKGQLKGILDYAKRVEGMKLTGVNYMRSRKVVKKNTLKKTEKQKKINKL
jgi:transketolase